MSLERKYKYKYKGKPKPKPKPKPNPKPKPLLHFLPHSTAQSNPFRIDPLSPPHHPSAVNPSKHQNSEIIPHNVIAPSPPLHLASINRCKTPNRHSDKLKSLMRRIDYHSKIYFRIYLTAKPFSPKDPSTAAAATLRKEE